MQGIPVKPVVYWYKTSILASQDPVKTAEHATHMHIHLTYVFAQLVSQIFRNLWKCQNIDTFTLFCRIHGSKLQYIGSKERPLQTTQSLSKWWYLSGLTGYKFGFWTTICLCLPTWYRFWSTSASACCSLFLKLLFFDKGYTGQNCNILIQKSDPCKPFSPCQNGGTCLNLPATGATTRPAYACVCRPGIKNLDMSMNFYSFSNLLRSYTALGYTMLVVRFS